MPGPLPALRAPRWPLRAFLVTVLSALLALSRPGVVGGESAWGGEAIGTGRASSVATTEDRPEREARADEGTGSERPRSHLVVRISADVPVRARPGGGGLVGVLPAASKYYRVPTFAWVIERSANGRFGRVPIAYGSGPRKTGWIPLQGLKRSFTKIAVHASLSRREIAVERSGRVILRFPAAVGAPASPTPPGQYFVTDRVPFAPGSYLGSFAFGLSGIQTRLPAGWSGGNQLAIHGTNDPASIGTAASAGCLRVSEPALDRLKPLLRLGTPVVIVA